MRFLSRFFAECAIRIEAGRASCVKGKRPQPLLAEIGSTAIVAGDLNAVPWSQTAQRVERASGTEILRGVGPTYLDRRFPAWMPMR